MSKSKLFDEEDFRKKIGLEPILTNEEKGLELTEVKLKLLKDVFIRKIQLWNQ